MQLLCTMMLKDVLTEMNSKNSSSGAEPFSIKFVTCDSKGIKGGEIISLEKALMCGLPYRSKQRIGIKKAGGAGHVYAVHQHLITEYKGVKVFC